MTAEPRVMRTEAEEALVEAFDATLPDLPGGAAVKATRMAAFDLFRANGLPHRRIEEWKYTDLRALVRTMAPIAPRPDVGTAKAALHAGPDPLVGLDHYRLVLVDGHFIEDLSDRPALLAEGVEVASTAELLAKDTKVVLDSIPLAKGDIVLALNAAFAADGVALNVKDGATPSKPIEIVHLTTGASATFVRNSALVGKSASLKLIETHRSPSGAQSNTATYLELAEAARVSAVRLQAEDPGALHLSTLMTRLASATELDHLTVTAGAAASRAQAYVSIEGEGVRLGLNGATMLSESRHADMTVVIDHVEPGSFSRVLTKNIVDGQATGAFQGKIIVEQDAQKTDGKMMNQSLHLSDDAWFASKPELEIYADDVQCGHGSTAGQIDETMLFYFLSRGIPRPEAEKLLITAFLAEAIETVGDEAIAEALEKVAAAWLSRRGGLARAA